MIWISCFILKLSLLLSVPLAPDSITCEERTPVSTIEAIYQRMGLESMLSLEAFSKGLKGLQRFHPAKRIIAICDFSKPSKEERFYVLDLDNQRLLLSSLVAHGRNSGLDRAVRFSNHPESNQSSLGFYRIGGFIHSPKHGQALLLDGLEKSLNGNARSRQIIIHGADYVCEQFVRTYGYLGRSLGCPALPNAVMKSIAPVLANGSLLYIYAGPDKNP